MRPCAHKRHDARGADFIPAPRASRAMESSGVLFFVKYLRQYPSGRPPPTAVKTGIRLLADEQKLPQFLGR